MVRSENLQMSQEGAGAWLLLHCPQAKDMHRTPR